MLQIEKKEKMGGVGGKNRQFIGVLWINHFIFVWSLADRDQGKCDDYKKGF
jgi:hypothetical protein